MAIIAALRFSQRAGALEASESYHVAVAQAPGRGWGGPLHAGLLDDEQAAVIRGHYADYLQRLQRGSWQAASAGELASLRAVGSQLFAALPETVQARLHKALALAQGQGQALELILTFEPSAQALLSLPWELLHSPKSQFFFALQGRLVRRLALPAAAAAEMKRPRSVLGVWAEPRGIAPLEERRRHGPAPGESEEAGAGIVWLEGAGTLEKLARALQVGGFDAMHVTAHGRGGGAQEAFALAFEDNQGEAQWLSGEQLTTFLSGYGGLQLVYLDVCAAGQSVEPDYAPGGLAVSLVQAGVPAVVVMQEDMAQRAAGMLASHFYAGLQRGDSAAEALSAGRRALRVELDDAVHWSVPALYTREGLPETVEALPLVDAFLDALRPQHVHAFLSLAALFLLVAHLSFQFARSTVGETTIVSLLLAQSAALPLLGVLLNRGGWARLSARYRLGRRERLRAALDGCFSAAVWAGMAWLVVLIVLLGVTWGGLWGRMDLSARQLLWALSLALVALAGYMGGRHRVRQAFLFLREGAPVRGWKDWLATLALPFMPLLLYYFVQWLWRQLGGG